MRVPAILVPFPAATDNHQWHNARAFQQSSAGWMLEQGPGAATALVRRVAELLGEPERLCEVRTQLARWDYPQAAAEIARRMLQDVAEGATAQIGAGRPADRSRNQTGTAASLSSTV
jgi:UDP-N-acetylglucosamine--N-acetylmuramyl-(pentapeptide) pyrophosphoryl-undecaprenol N-acetylglucosamine transferase